MNVGECIGEGSIVGLSKAMHSLDPAPFFTRAGGRAGRKKGPGIHCLRMCRFFNDFVETVNYTGHSRILSS